MIVTERFTDRAEAGRVLARQLARFAGRPNIAVLALPRGGVAVGYEIARLLQAPLDVLVVRKLGVPGREELAMGAIAAGIVVADEATLNYVGLDRATFDAVVERERRELARREERYRGGLRALDSRGKSVILVDDGLATGSTMHAAVAALRKLAPERIIIAVPVASPEAIARLRKEVDEIVCPSVPELFYAVGAWYDEFAQLTDEDVCALLYAARRERTA